MLFLEFIDVSPGVQSKLFMLTVIFAALTQGRCSTLSFFFSDEAWRPLPGEISIHSRKTSLRILPVEHQKEKVQSSLPSLPCPVNSKTYRM